MIRLKTVLFALQKPSNVFKQLTLPLYLKRFNSTLNVKVCPTHGYICSSPYGVITAPETTIDKYVWKNVNLWSNKVATECVETGRKYTYGELRDASGAFAKNLQKQFNLKSHDVIAVSLPNIPEYPIVILGAYEAGLKTSLMNPIYGSDEIARQLKICDTKLVVCTPLNYEEMKKACTIAKYDIPIICINFMPELQTPRNAINFFEMIKSENFVEIKQSDIKFEDVSVIPFSSGTTGLAKGVMLTHKNIISNCEMVQKKLPHDTYIKETTENNQDVIPCFLPFFHIFGFTICMMSKLYLGCKLVTFPKFTAQNLLSSLRIHKGTMLNLAPPILLMLINSENIKSDDLESVKFIMSGAAPVGLSDIDRLLSKFPKLQFAQGYGLTETSPAAILTPIGNKKYSSVGFPVSSTEIKFISYDGSDLKGLDMFKDGELCIRGPQVMKGYLNNEQENKNIFLADGWLRTGDIGHYDDEGYIFITDRIKELIKVKGYQVPPAELEELLRSHPKILDAAVFGIEDKRSGEIPKAVVVLKKNENVTEKEIFNFIAEKVPPYKKLTGGVVFVQEIPKNASGKIIRRELKEKYSNK